MYTDGLIADPKKVGTYIHHADQTFTSLEVEGGAPKFGRVYFLQHTDAHSPQGLSPKAFDRISGRSVTSKN